MFRRKKKALVGDSFVTLFEIYLTQPNLFPDHEVIASVEQLDEDDSAMLHEEEVALAIAYTYIRMLERKSDVLNPEHIRQSFFAALVHVADNFDKEEQTAFRNRVLEYVKAVDAAESEDDRHVESFDVFVRRLLGGAPLGYTPLLSLAKFIRFRVVNKFVDDDVRHYTLD